VEKNVDTQNFPIFMLLALTMHSTKQKKYNSCNMQYEDAIPVIKMG